MRKVAIKFIFIAFSILAPFLFAGQVFAAKQINLTTSSVQVEAGKEVEVSLEIDTGGDKVGAMEFGVNFDTEILDGRRIDKGPACPMSSGDQSFGKFGCGITGQDGFSGKGLAATLVFKGRKAGSAIVSLKDFRAVYGPEGRVVDGFSLGTVSITVYGQGQKPAEEPNVETPTEQPGTNNSNNTSNTSNAGTGQTIKQEEAPQIPAAPPIEQKNIENSPSSSLGSESQVEGQTGAEPEEPIKRAETQKALEDMPLPQAIVKGIQTKDPLYLSFLPTLILLILAAYLGVKLYFTEKRRHLEVERLFDSHLGTLAALESKIGILGDGEDSRDRLVAEFEEAKNNLNLEISGGKESATEAKSS